MGSPLTPHDLASRLEHTNLRPDASHTDIAQLCGEADEHRFRAVVVNPVRVAAARKALDADLVVASVVGFPLGASLTTTKISEAQQAVMDGATSIDLVINFGWVIDGALERAADEVYQTKSHLPEGIEMKVIIEAPLLSDDLIAAVATRVVDAGADVVKTGTGTAGSVTVEQVRLIRKAVGPDVTIKAAGGIRTLAQCRELIDAGADLLGCSGCVTLMQEASKAD